MFTGILCAGTERTGALQRESASERSYFCALRQQADFVELFTIAKKDDGESLFSSCELERFEGNEPTTGFVFHELLNPLLIQSDLHSRKAFRFNVEFLLRATVRKRVGRAPTRPDSRSAATKK